MLNRFLIFTMFLLHCFKLSGQCTSVKIETDAFDSTRVIYDKPLNIGGLVTSNFEVEEGNKMVEEAKLLVSYAENDSIESRSCSNKSLKMTTWGAGLESNCLSD